MNSEVKSEVLDTTEVSKKSKGELFKERHGISKTFYRNMLRQGLNPFKGEGAEHTYRKLRKARKAKEANLRKEKHHKALGNRNAKKSGKAKTTEVGKQKK